MYEIIVHRPDYPDAAERQFMSSDANRWCAHCDATALALVFAFTVTASDFAPQHSNDAARRHDFLLFNIFHASFCNDKDRKPDERFRMIMTM